MGTCVCVVLFVSPSCRLDCGPDDSGFESGRRQEVCLYIKETGPAVGPWGRGRGKRPGREANHSLPCSAEIQIEWSYISASSIRLLGVCRDNFMFL